MASWSAGRTESRETSKTHVALLITQRRQTPPAGHSGSGMIVAAELMGEMACRGLIIPSAVNPGKPSRPAPSGQGHSSGGALYLDRWDLARTPSGRVDGRRDDQEAGMCESAAHGPCPPRARKEGHPRRFTVIHGATGIVLDLPAAGPAVAATSFASGGSARTR